MPPARGLIGMFEADDLVGCSVIAPEVLAVEGERSGWEWDFRDVGGGVAIYVDSS